MIRALETDKKPKSAVIVLTGNNKIGEIRVEIVNLVCSPKERKVIEMLINEKKDIDQRRIVKETDFSKTKVSRIIQNLVDKDLIEKIPKGRNNLIRLKTGGKLKK